MGKTFTKKKIFINMELFSGTISGDMSTNIYSLQKGYIYIYPNSNLEDQMWFMDFLQEQAKLKDSHNNKE